MNRSLRAPSAPPPLSRGRLRAYGAALIGLMAFAGSAGAADRKPTPPEITFSFESLNIPGLSSNFLNAGASMMTLHFVDGNHLLLTYGLRELVPRLVGDSPDDDDRLVGAELVELPDGKVLAKARWHMHDHGRYLWSLNNGRFLVRQGDELSTFAPLANLSTQNPFLRTALPHRPGVLDAVVVSPDGKLLTIESHKAEPQRLTGRNINVLTSGDLPVHPQIAYEFYRLTGTGGPDAPLRPTRAGNVLAPEALRLPIDGDGYLVASGGKRGRWNVEFESFTGSKPLTVGVVDSNCRPGLELVSSTQYLAFTCRAAGSPNVTVAAYDFAKNDIWEESMGDFSIYAPTFAFAPAAGRFAISRKTDQPAPGVATNTTGDITTQEVRVYGTQTGDLLMKANCVPAFRTSENFDLSPDGMRLGVIRNGNIEVYRLPELTKTDREDLVELAKLTPPPATGQLNLHRLTHRTEEGARESAGGAEAAEIPDEDKTSAPAAAPVNATAAAPGTASPVPPTLASDGPGPATPPSGDIEIRRKPPTLLNPGETAESGPKKKEQQN